MNKIENKFYTREHVWWASVLGGPLIGCYLVSQNYRNFGQAVRARKLFVVSVTISLLLIALLINLPEDILASMPKWVKHTIPLSYTIFWASYVEQFQAYCIKNNVAQGWQKYSAKRVVFLALISLIISFLYTLLIGFLVLNVF